MRFLLTGRNLDVTPPLRQLVERKLSKLDRLLNDSAVSCQAVLTQQKHRHVVEITIHARGDNMLHGLGSGAAWPIAVKQAMDKIAAQAQTLKGKWNTRKRRATPAKVLAPPARRPAAAPEAAPAGSRIIRATRYPVKPMSLEDAALRVENSPDEFLVFRNAATEAVAILYRRKDGHLGLIEP